MGSPARRRRGQGGGAPLTPAAPSAASWSAPLPGWCLPPRTLPRSSQRTPQTPACARTPQPLTSKHPLSTATSDEWVGSSLTQFRLRRSGARTAQVLHQISPEKCHMLSVPDVLQFKHRESHKLKRLLHTFGAAAPFPHFRINHGHQVKPVHGRHARIEPQVVRRSS